MEILSIQILHFMFCFLLIGCAFCVSFSFNSVESVIFLILTFLNGAGLLFLFNVDFLGIVFIIIYVGAVAVLFLFVIMMLNVKNDEIGRQKHYKSAIIYSILYLFLITLAFIKMNGWFDFFLLTREFFFLDFDCFSNIDVLRLESVFSNHTIRILSLTKTDKIQKTYIMRRITNKIIFFFKDLFFKVKTELLKKATKIKGFPFNDWVSFFIVSTLLISGVCVFIVKNLPLIYRTLFHLNEGGYAAAYYLAIALFKLDDIALFCGVLCMQAYLLGIIFIFSYQLIASFLKNYSSFSLKFLLAKHLAILSNSLSLLREELYKSKKDIFNTFVNVFLSLSIAYFLIMIFCYYS